MAIGADEFSLEELERLFGEDGQATPPVNDETAPPAPQPTGETSDESGTDSIESTKAFAKRLAEKSAKEAEKARQEERDRIAKELGYESYEALQKKREAKLLEDKGIDPSDVAPVVEEIVKQRLENDPRMKELELLRQQQVQEFAKKELEELKVLTGGEIANMEQIPADVIEQWKQIGSLKKAYIALHGEELLIKARSAQSKGGTQHLQNPAGAPPAPATTRPFTAKEKELYKFFNPGVTQEELDKMTKQI